MVHSRMWYSNYIIGNMTSWRLTFSYIFFPEFVSKVITTLATTIQIFCNNNNGFKNNNAMLEIQATKNIVLFPTKPYLKNVITSLSNEKEKK
jgi:hypothetical protein